MLALEEYSRNPCIRGVLGESSHRRNTGGESSHWGILGGILALEEYWVRNARNRGIFEESSPRGDIGEYLRGPRIGGRFGEECSHWKDIGGIGEIP
jgi:hypothetical protein